MKRNVDEPKRHVKSQITAQSGEQPPLFYNDHAEYMDKKRAVKKRARSRRVILAVVILLAAALIYLNWDKLSPSSIGTLISDTMDNMGESKFPVVLSQGDFVKGVPLGNDIGVLTDTGFLIYSPTGTLLAERQHGMSSPAVEASGSNAVLFDRGGKQYKIESRGAESAVMQTNYAILAAAVSENGSYAIVTESSSYLSEVRVYDRNRQNVFTYFSAEARVLSAALSPDGRSLAIATASAKNGDILAGVKFFHVDSKQPVGEQSYPGLTLFNIQFKDNSTAAAVGDNAALFFTSDGKEVKRVDYGDKVLKAYSNTAFGTVLVFSQYGVGAASEIYSYSSAGNLKGQAALASDIKYVYTGNNAIAAYAQQGVWHSGADCKNASTTKVNGDMMGALSLGSKIYAFGLQSVYQYSIG